MLSARKPNILYNCCSFLLKNGYGVNEEWNYGVSEGRSINGKGRRRN